MRGRLIEWLLWTRNYFRLYRIENKKPIIIYQMGKVGSSSIASTLKASDINRPVLHVHTLNNDTHQRAIAKTKAAKMNHLPEHLIVSGMLISKFEKNRFPCNLITLTREPVSRAISFAFEDWQKKVPINTNPGELDFQVMEDVINNMLKETNGHSDPTLWFNSELKSVFNIDVFEHPYDFKKGYTILDNESHPLLVMRLEDIQKAIPEALQLFISKKVSKTDIQKANLGKNKWYASLIKQVKEAYTLPHGIAEQIFNTTYFQHFYKPDQDKIRSQWIN